MNERLPFLQQKTSRLTFSPGVYLMKNSDDQIIYIGKAKSLRKRVSSYFRNNPNHTPKVHQMVENVYDYDFIVTDTECEALILECSLIKQHKPKYNILLKDDKGYFYIKISDDIFPRVTAEKNTLSKGEYFGPYTSAFTVSQTVDEINKLFRLPTCKYHFDGKRSNVRPCLNFHIDQCIGICNNNISPEEYMEIIDQVRNYINKGGDFSIKQLEIQMQKASDNLEFEKAARIRDRIKAISKAGQQQKIFDDDLKSSDFVASSVSTKGACISVLKYRNGRLFDKLIFPFSVDESDEKLTENFLSMYYLSQDEIPKNIVVDEKQENWELLKTAFAEKCGHSVKFIFPQKGSMLRYIMLSKSNADEYLSIQNNRTGKEIAALEELAKILGLGKPPEYIESYDISNLSSSSLVAGMVVFKNGRPYKKAYKRFSIKDSVIQNDYACMQEVLERRFNEYFNGTDEGFKTKPDLILLDGGKGHVGAVMKVMNHFGLDIPVYGLVKDNKHRTRAIATNGGEISVSKTSPAFILMTKIQDEVHRFAISYMKSKHTKNSFSFELMKVKGIGLKKAQKLILEYKTMEALKSATAEELSHTAGVNPDTGKELYELIKNL
ncbi:MAG: excinuclease ABC subunit UvrC [Porcipelethomonas sp.]